MKGLKTTDTSRRWCRLNFGPLRGHVKLRNFPERIDARRKYFYFFIQMSWNNWQNLNGIILGLNLDNSCWLRNLRQTPNTTYPSEIKLANPIILLTTQQMIQVSFQSFLTVSLLGYDKINLSNVVQVFFESKSNISKI